MRPYVLLILAPLFWSGNWIIGRGLHEILSPIALNFWRWVIALLVLAVFVGPGLQEQWSRCTRHWKTLCALGFLGIVVFQLMIYTGLKYTTVINAVVLNSTMPVFLIAAGWAMLGETITLRQAAGGLISFTGIVAIVSRGDMQTLLAVEFSAGDVLILLAMPVWAIYSVVLKRADTGLSGLETLAGMTAFALAIMLPLYLADAFVFDHHVRVSTPSWGAIAYVGVFAGVGAFYCWNEGVRGAGPAIAGFMYHLLPAFASLGAVVTLGESLFAYQVVGIFLILSGVYMSTRNARIANTE